METKIKWTKSSSELVERFRGALPKDPALEARTMFGYPAAFVRGNYFAGLFEQAVVIRMPEPQKSALAALASAEGFSPMGGKPMTDWYVVPSKIASNAALLARFLRDALARAKELPPKATKKKATGTSARGTTRSRSGSSARKTSGSSRGRSR